MTQHRRGMQEAVELHFPEPDGGGGGPHEGAPAAGLMQAIHAHIAAATTAAHHIGYSLQVVFGVLVGGPDAEEDHG